MWVVNIKKKKSPAAYVELLYLIFLLLPFDGTIKKYRERRRREKKK